MLVGILLGLVCDFRGQQQATADAESIAYQALADGDLERAATHFQVAVQANAKKAPLRKDFAYLLVRMGDTIAAREQFREVTRISPQDSHAALEYAFLCHETGQQSQAWKLFRSLRNAREPEHRKTARDTFTRLDAELQTRAKRLRAAVAVNPGDDTSHTELGRVLTIRNEFAEAASHFKTAYRLKPDFPDRLLLLAEAASQAGDEEQARAALLLASRSSNGYVAEQARGLLPERYPYLYEFQNALALDPANATVGREIGFFLLSLGRREEAVRAFHQVLTYHPDDALVNAQLGFLFIEDGDPRAALPLLQRALDRAEAPLQQRLREVIDNIPSQDRSAARPSRIASPPRGDSPPPETSDARTSMRSSSDPAPSQPADITPATAMPIEPGLLSLPLTADADAGTVLQRAAEARELGRKSYDSGFIPDAIRHYRAAHELDPTNFDTILQLGYSMNMAKQDEDAVQWFFLAARSPEPRVAAEATRALRNLTTPAPSGAAQAQASPAASGVVSSFWAMPMHSTRWGSTFAFSQAKSELQQEGWPVVPYVSLRFVGDTTGAVGVANPQFLSENAFILGGGLRTKPKNGFMVWAEAGSAMAYLGSQRSQTSTFAPDYRGGLSQFKLAGPSLLATRAGWFGETMNDLVYIHRFDRNTLAISRNRVGRHFGTLETAGGLQAQLFLNININADFQRQAWANFIETGPGIRFRWQGLPPSMSFTFSILRGHHPIPRIDGRPNTYTDFQAGLWYAFTR